METSSLVKSLALLEATAADATGKSLATLAAEVGVPKPTAHRILKTLTTLGYLERFPQGIYRQTPKVRQLVAGEVSQRLLSRAEPVLRRLHDETHETINLGVLRSDQIVYLRVLESTHPLRRVVTPNSVDPFYSTALGRAIVSHLPEAEREALIQRVRLERRTASTNVAPKTLAKILARAARDGYALEVDETDVGVTCIGAPILEEGTAIGAISISVPTARASGEALSGLVEKVRRGAQLVSRQLGAPPDKSPRKRIRASAVEATA